MDVGVGVGMVMVMGMSEGDTLVAAARKRWV